MSDMESRAPSLPAEGAFVIQLFEGVDGDSVPLEGRAEHVVSGRSSRFSNLEELARFLSACLGSHPAQPGQGSLEGRLH